MSGDWSHDSACASAAVLHLSGSGSVLIEALLVRHCVRFVNFFIGFNLRMVVAVAAAAALPMVPLPPPAVAVVLLAPEQAHRNDALPPPLRVPGSNLQAIMQAMQAICASRLRQSSKTVSLS